MTALTTIDDTLNRATGGNNGNPETRQYLKTNRVDSASAQLPVADRMVSLWRYNGIPGGASASPGAVAAPTSVTEGALPFTNPGGVREKFLTGIEIVATTAVGTSTTITGLFCLYDRILHVSGLSGTTVTAQAVGGTLTRYTGAASVGNRIFVEIYTQIGASVVNISANYLNQVGASATTQTISFGGTGLREPQRFIELPLAAGDTGVQSVTDVTSGNTGTTGDYGVTVVRQLISVPICLGGYTFIRDLFAQPPGPPKVESDACLFGGFFCNTAVAIDFRAQLDFLER